MARKLEKGTEFKVGRPPSRAALGWAEFRESCSRMGWGLHRLLHVGSVWWHVGTVARGLAIRQECLVAHGLGARRHVDLHVGGVWWHVGSGHGGSRCGWVSRHPCLLAPRVWGPRASRGPHRAEGWPCRSFAAGDAHWWHVLVVTCLAARACCLSGHCTLAIPPLVLPFRIGTQPGTAF